MCKDTDSKREDIKWLVQTLDSLTSHSPQTQALEEQKKLEALITRYKNLIPSLEITMVRTETLSKCYTYRREVREVCSLLTRVREQTKREAKPESWENVKELIQQQENAVTQLDLQRPNIMSMLQRGKDLSKDTNVPEFIQEEVKTLESGWSKTYQETVEKLRELKTTQQLYDNYSEQKNEILSLLSRAEQELKQLAPGQYNSSNLPGDLLAKQQMAVRLREAMEHLLKKLRDLCVDLSKLTGPEKKPLLEKEVKEIEERLHSTLENIQERVVFLEQFQTKYTEVQSKLGHLQDWTTQHAPQLLSAVQESDMLPEDRISKSTVLQSEVAQKINLIGELGSEAKQLFVDEVDNPEAQKLKTEIVSLQERVLALNRTVEEQAASVAEDLQNWEKYQSSLQEIKPWIESAETKISAGLSKPVTLDEAIHLQTQAKKFSEECDVQQKKLKEITEITQQITAKTCAPDELDAINSRWIIINETSTQWGNKLDKLVANWQEFDKNAQDLENWVEKCEKSLASYKINLNTPDVEKLEKEINKLKAHHKEIVEQQAKLIPLTQSSESISHSISPEGVPIVKGRVQELKSKISDLADSVRAKINEVSDAILAKHEFQTKMADFINWTVDMQNRVERVNEIPADKVDAALNNVHILLQEHAEKQPLSTSIYEEVKNIVSITPREESEPLNQQYSNMIQNYQNIEHTLKEKKTSLEKWTELLNWHEDSNQQISHIKYQLENQESNPQILTKLIKEIQSIITKLITWKENAIAIDKNETINILDKQTGSPTSAENLVREIEVKAINLKSQLAEKLDGLQKLKASWEEFKDVQKQVTEGINKTQNQIQNIADGVKKIDDIETAIDSLNKLLDAQAEESPLRENLRQKALQLIKEDIKNVSTIQNILAEIDSAWDKNHETIREQKLKYSDTVFAWKEFQESRERVEKEISKISLICDGLEPPSDLIQANLNNDKVKKALEALQKSKMALDKMDAKGNAIIKKTDFIPGVEPQIKNEMQKTHQNWTEMYQKVITLAQTTESQSIIWKHIDETKVKLLVWLTEQNSIINQAAENPNDVETARAKLSKYREQLPAHLSLKESISNKEKQLAKLTDQKEIASLQTLKKVLEEQFSTLQNNAQKLEEITDAFASKDRALRDTFKEISNNVSSLREQIIKCEDLSGDNAKILERLVTVRKLKQQLLNQESNIKNIEQQIQQLKAAYPTFADGNLLKEQQNLKKRYDSIVTHANKIENSLLTFLKKFHNEKYGALQRIIATHLEKVQWCTPEQASDKYNLEVKLTSLLPISEAIQDCDQRKIELENSLAALETVESPEVVKLLNAEKDHLSLELENLKQKYDSTKNLLENSVSKHQSYEELSEALSNWLKDVENRVKVESTAQVDINTIDKKVEDIEKIQEEVSQHETQIQQLTSLCDELAKESPDARLKQYVQHLTTRYQAVVKFISNYLDKLDELKKYNQLYSDSIKDVENWLVNAEETVQSFAGFTTSGSRPNQATLEELKNFACERNQGQALLSRAVEQGEALFSGITTENRDNIRAELRKLRDKSEALIDKVNDIYKQVETILMQRHSFDDSLAQVKQWLSNAENKLGKELELSATLSEKKQILHNYKTLAQDVEVHKNILKQLQEKIGNLNDLDAENKLDNSLQNYKKLSEDVNKRVEIVDKHVSHHENYNAAIEKFHDWLSALTSEASFLVDDTSSNNADSKLSIIENLLSQKTEGDSMIDSCKQQLEVVLLETAPEGHPSLINSFEEQANAWKMFLDMCLNAQSKLKELHSEFAKFNGLIENLEGWLKQKESQVKDQSLRSTQETKQTHLTKLKSLEAEILEKENDFSDIVEQARTIDVDSETTAKALQMNNRYQALKNIAKENINRYESFVKEHADFNENYSAFLKWLSDREETLQKLSHIVGDVAVLQERQKQIRELIDDRNQKSEEFENLISSGEKLYAHTSPDGREIVRQQIRNLRTIWDGFTDDLQTATTKLDQCLMQFSDFTATQEQLTKWLKDVEKAMHQHTELKATLQEKRAQLQNHRIMHQEIMSHQQLVESVCDKAQQLVNQTQDKSLNIYLQSIKQLFNNIVTKSEDLLKNLEECVDKHNAYNLQIIAFKDWLSTETDKAQEYDDVTGEKQDIEKKIASLSNIKTDNENKGREKLEDLKKQLTVVAKSTAPKGNEELQKELDTLTTMLQQHLKEIGKYILFYLILYFQISFCVDIVSEKQVNTLKLWNDFESELNQHTSWFKDTESKLREQPLQATLPEKEEQLKIYSKERDEIFSKEKEIDLFIDKCHALLQVSDVQRIKPLSGQITTKYQTIHTSVKEIVNHWQNLVDSHANYDKKLQETSQWLKTLEEHMDALQQGELSKATANRLQILLTEKEQGEHKINSLVLTGERLFSDTAAQGREKIRNDLREIRERWDKLEEGIRGQQKLQETQSLQLSSYQEMLAQTLAWLNAMEKVVHIEPTSWTSIQEVRGKLLKHKTALQEIVSYKRIIEGITVKAQNLLQLTADKDKPAEVEETIKSIKNRYQNLVENANQNIQQLENCLDVYQQFYDLQKAQEQYQKQLWEKLASFSDLTGSKQMIQDRLNKVTEIQDHLPETGIKLKELEDHVEAKTSVIPARAREEMQRDVANLKFDLGKFVAAVNDMKCSLEDKLKQWNDYEELFDKLLSWLTEAEMLLKNYELKGSVEEKQEQLEKYQVSEDSF